MTDAPFMKASSPKSKCEIHWWSPEDVRRNLAPLLRERQGNGAISICRQCLDKAKAAAAKEADRDKEGDIDQ